MDKHVSHDATLEESFEGKLNVSMDRDSSGKITSYSFTIMVQDQPNFTGVLTREEMERVHRLYSSEGVGLTQRSVVREFPQYTFSQFKKILRAFNITKSSAPLAPHQLEELSAEEAVALTLQNRENDFFKKLDQERIKYTERRLDSLMREFSAYKESVGNFQEFLTSLDLSANITPPRCEISTDNTIIVYLSDMHIGADVSQYSIFANEYNVEEVKSRLNKIFEHVVNMACMTQSTNLIICNIGDSLDGYDGMTTRGGHSLPQNMNNKDQLKNYIQLMIDFFASFSATQMFGSIKYYCVEGGNHDGDFGYAANFALQTYLNNVGIEAVLFDKYINHFKSGGHTFVLCHGKDAKDVFRNMPLVINDSTANQIDEYLDYHKITGSVHFVKGDLHQSATTFAKRFRYKSVASLFGSSEWIHKNFGNTKAACDIDIIVNNSVIESRIVLN